VETSNTEQFFTTLSPVLLTGIVRENPKGTFHAKSKGEFCRHRANSENTHRTQREMPADSSRRSFLGTVGGAKAALAVALPLER